MIARTSFLGLSLILVGCFVVGVSSAWAECSADDQAAYATCVDSAAASCLASQTSCDSTNLVTTHSAALVNSVVDRCCAKSGERAQLACATQQITRLALAKLVIPAGVYSKFRQVATAAIKELRDLKKNKTLCDTGSN